MTHTITHNIQNHSFNFIISSISIISAYKQDTDMDIALFATLGPEERPIL